MRNLLLILVVLTFIACGGEEKKKPEPNKNSTEKKKEEKPEPKFNFPVVDNLLESQSLINLSETSHSFEDDIVFEEINVLKTADNTYTFIFVVNEKVTNFEKLQQWKLGMYFFAKDPKQFEDKAHVKKGYKTMATLVKPKMMGNEVVIVLKDFKIKPKEIKLLRLYLYNNNSDMNKNYYNTKDIVLP